MIHNAYISESKQKPVMENIGACSTIDSNYPSRSLDRAPCPRPNSSYLVMRTGAFACVPEVGETSSKDQGNFMIQMWIPCDQPSRMQNPETSVKAP